MSSTKKIHIEPTWTGTLPTLILLLEKGAPPGKAFAREELARMAEIADKHPESGLSMKCHVQESVKEAK